MKNGFSNCNTCMICKKQHRIYMYH
jgi:hypothetical protein